MQANDLSPKEIEVCKMVLKFEGKATNKEIADAMTLSTSTIMTHFNNIYQKLLISSKTELIYYLMTHCGWNNPKGLSKKGLFKITKADKKGEYNISVGDWQGFIRYILQFSGGVDE